MIFLTDERVRRRRLFWLAHAPVSALFKKGELLSMALLTTIATGAVAVLVAVLAVYLALRVLGKLAKLVIGIVAVALILWLLFSGRGMLNDLLPLAGYGTWLF